MAGPPDPPPPDWDLFSGTPTEFNTAQSNAFNHGWDSSKLAILDAGGADNYLAVGKSAVTGGRIAWFFRTATDSGDCVYCQVPSLTFSVVKNGTLNTSNGTISYNGHVYQLQLRRDGTTGNAIAFAFQVS